MKPTVSFLLQAAVLLQAVLLIQSCGSKPSPCSWTTCRREFREDWVPPAEKGRCVEQFRFSHFKTLVRHGSGTCPAPQPCKEKQRQHRLKCKLTLTSYTLRVVNSFYFLLSFTVEAHLTVTLLLRDFILSWRNAHTFSYKKTCPVNTEPQPTLS